MATDFYTLHVTAPNTLTSASILEALVLHGFCVMRVDERGVRFQGPPNCQVVRVQVVSEEPIGDVRELLADALKGIPHYGFVIYQSDYGDCEPGTT